MDTPLDSAPGTLAEPASNAGEALLREACDELERRISSGESARTEEYLARHPQLDAEQALDLIYVEYAARRDVGEPPPRDELMARFPQWQGQLQRQFQLDELLDEAPPASGGQAPRAGSRFRVMRLLARGGIGQVMRALDTELNREVAVKELQPAHADDDAIRERFLREAEITGKLEHPGIVPVYGLGSDAQGRPFYAMRLVRGQSFQEATHEFHQRGGHSHRFTGVEFQKLLRRFLHVCETVAFAHSRGIIHRDLKPANILLGPFGETLVVDWGLARANSAQGPQVAEASARPVAHWSSELTQVSGQLIGTPAFMSPEQALGAAHDVGPAADVYSLGATLYMLLTDQVPFAGKNIGETLQRVAAGKFARPREISRDVPRALEAVCLKAMARRPDERYASPRDLADDLEHWLADEPVKAAPESLVTRVARWGRRHRSRVVAGALALLVTTAVSLAAAILINNERLRADHERIEANRRNARLAFDRGFGLTGEHEFGAAMLWFARALEHAPPGDEAMRRVILTNIHAARHHLLRRQRAFKPEGSLTLAVFSPDGQRLLTTDESRLCMLWDAESGSLLAEHPLASGRQVAAGFSADATAIVATYQRPALEVHRLPAAAAEAGEPPLAISHADDIARAVFDPSGHLLATATPTGPSAKTRIWRINDGQLMAELNQPGVVEQIVFQPRTDAVAIVYSDGAVRLWQVPTNRLVCEFRATGSRLIRVAFTADGKRLLAGDSVGALSCWNAENGQRLFDLARHSGNVTAVTCASDGQTVAAAWDTGTTRTWILDARRPASELLRLDRYTSTLAFRPGQRQLMVAAQMNELVLWQLPDLDSRAPPLNQQVIQSVAFSRDAKIAATASFNGTARLRDGVTGRAFGEVMSHSAGVTTVAFRPPDDAVVLTASRDGTARLWKAASGLPHCKPMQHRPNSSSRIQVDAAAFSPDGRLIVTGDNAGVVRIWNGDTGELIREVDDRGGNVLSVCFSPSGEQIVAGLGAPESGVLLWNVAGGAARWKGPHSEPTRRVSLSPDGRVVLSGSNDDTAKIWDALTGQPLGQPLVHGGEVWVARFSPDGRTAVTGGFDATLRLWSVPAGKLIGEPMRHEGVVMDAVFSSDGQRLLTGSGDGSARLWDVATCLPLSPPLPHGEWVRAVGISPAGDMALTGRAWHLPVPLPDDLPRIDLWVRLATERAFNAGDNIEWLDRAALDALASEFHSRTGKSWQEWAAGRRLSPGP